MDHVKGFQQMINQCIEDMKNQGFDDSNRYFKELCEAALINDSVIKAIEMNQDNANLMKLVVQDIKEDMEFIENLQLKENDIVSISMWLVNFMKWFQMITLDYMKKEDII